jgi:DNA-binding XRE family transcriptional regulator
MKLKQYLQSEGIKQIEFAKKLDVSRRTMDFIVAGESDMKMSTAFKIVKLTRGAVTYKDLVPPHLL